MDLSQFDSTVASDDGVLMSLRDPTTGKVLHVSDDDDTPVTIKLLGEDSEKFRALAHRRQNTRIRDSVDARGRIRITSEQIEDDELEVLVACTVGWEGVDVDGEMLEFSLQNVRKLYARFKWIREQASQFIADRSNYLGNSLTTF